MSIPSRSDVLVVGGGPAGSTAATMLARSGYDVVLADKAHHPRETVGESVLPSAWRYFDRLGVADEVMNRFVKKAGGIVVWGDQISQIAFRDFGYSRAGLHVERDELDELLLRNAARSGVRVAEGVRATGFRHGDGVRTTLVAGGEAHEHRSRYLVDATGQASLVARQLGCRRLDPGFRFVALWGYFADSRYVSSGGVVRGFAEIPNHPPMTFVSRLGGWGWSWHIPMRQRTSVGIVVPIDEYKSEAPRHGTLEDYYISTCRRSTQLARLLEGARLAGSVKMLRDFSYIADTVALPGVLVIGDAAGFVDPIFSIGVVMALYSGELVAWTIDRVLRRPGSADAAHGFFANQMHGRYQLARGMALPGIGADGSEAASAYFDFFSQSEKDLMWSAASMTTRSANILRVSGSAAGPPALKRTELAALHF